MGNLEAAMSEAMTSLGIDPSASEGVSESNSETQSTEAEGDTSEEVVETKDAEEAPTEETDAPEGEEKTEVSATEKVAEEPKLTAKEFQEIQAARQELELKEKSFMDRMAAQEKEFQAKYQDKVKAHDDLDGFLAHAADTDPELFELFKAGYQEWSKANNDPRLARTNEKIEQLQKQLESFTAKASDEVTRTKLDAEISQVKAGLGKEAEAAGVKIDWAKVEDTWADNPKLSIEAAVYALYGANITKASASKAKVAAVENKIQSRPKVATVGTAKSANASGNGPKNSSTDGWIAHFAKQFAG